MCIAPVEHGIIESNSVVFRGISERSGHHRTQFL
jgi:hypothetical protein